MKPSTALHAPFLALALVFAATAPNPANAQTHADHGKADAAATPELSDGEVRRIDRETGRITIRHGVIRHMDMPPMTMVFIARDKALLDKASVGARIRFMAVHENGQMLVTDIQPAP